MKTVMTDEDHIATLKLAYEFMFAEYRREQRKTKHLDPIRLEWIRPHILRYQTIMRELLPDAGLTFAEL